MIVITHREENPRRYHGGEEVRNIKLYRFFLILILLIPLLLLSKQRLYAYCWCAILLLFECGSCLCAVIQLLREVLTKRYLNIRLSIPGGEAFCPLNPFLCKPYSPYSFSLNFETLIGYMLFLNFQSEDLSKTVNYI
jgi:hypothetical protein